MDVMKNKYNKRDTLISIQEMDGIDFYAQVDEVKFLTQLTNFETRLKEVLNLFNKEVKTTQFHSH